MISSRYLLIPFALQMLCMAFDEFHFHWRRSLPRWERLGHPLDTLTVFISWIYILAVEPSTISIPIFIALAIFSCLFVTKDEWVHTKACAGGENWLHAVLFMLHPLMFLSAGLLWAGLHVNHANFNLIHYEGFEHNFFIANLSLTFLFGMYQLIYWNWIWKPLLKPRSITTSIKN
jgi:hypothetical protein